MKNYIVKYIRLYRVVDIEETEIEKDLRKLGEFIKQRSNNKKDITYITISFITKNNVDGLIILRGKDKEKIDVEAEIITDYIESSLKALAAKKIKNPRNIELIPIPGLRNFLLEEAV
ncbi:hypothetical protein [Staphylothermus marinus]|uniref:hypothetical protein n=1 Tax=Staphylothermus marinus TaxID=2280 RepID=UPI000325A0E9|nr:hypothetical protein [Staphylothermus marinus]